MPTTTNVALDVPAHGSNVDTWDTSPINNNAQAIDRIFGSVTSISVSGNTTLTTTQLDVSILRFTGVNNSTVTVNVSAVRKAWYVENKCTGAGVVVLTGGAGNACAAPPGPSQLYWDGSNVDYLNMQKVGEYFFYAVTTTAPPWIAACTVPPYLACDGSAYSNVTYPVLYQILQTTTLPDARGKAWNAVDPTGTILSQAICGINGTAIGARGGAANATLARANLPNARLNIGGSYLYTSALFGSQPGNTQDVFSVSGTSGLVTDYLSGGVSAQVAMTTIGPTIVGGTLFIRAG